MRALIALFATALFTTAVADDSTYKQDKSHDKSMSSAESKFDKLDRNNDQQLSKTEAQRDRTLSAQFQSVDQNADGAVSKSEFTAQLSTDSTKSDREPY